MTLKIQTEDKSLRFVPGERLYLTADNKLVKHGDPRAVALFCSEFSDVSRAEYDRLHQTLAAKKPIAKPETKRIKRKTKK